MGRLRSWIVACLVAALTVVGLPSAGVTAVSPAEAQVPVTDPEADALLAIIERFTDRTEDFWDESRGTFDATGAGTTQPRGEGNIALAYATLLTERPDQATFGEEAHPRATLLDHADRTIAHAARTNRSQGGGWGGGSWQAALETYGWGLAAYMLRDQLSAETLDVVGDVIRYESDILVTKPAAGATPGNTGAEDNAWNAPLPALAAGWWPEHERADDWRAAARRHAVNAATVPGDDEDDATLVDGRPLSYWAETENLLPDFTMENHGFFNPLYQQVAPFNLGEGILIHRMTGQEVPEAFEFRTEQIYDDILAPLVTPDGDLLLTHGQDWTAKDYQHLGYLTLMGTWFGRPDANEYASRARAVVEGRQDARDDGALIGQADVGYETVLVKRMVAAYLLRTKAAPAATTDAAGLAAIEAPREGVHTYEASKFAVHRLDGTIRSVNWTSAKPMGLLVPDGTRHPDPVLVHYLAGSLIGANASGVSAASCDCDEDAFAVAQIVGGRGHATASLPNGLMPMLEAGTGATFPIALERIPGVTDDRPVTGPDGPITGTADVPWFDIAGRIGVVVQGGAGVRVERGLPTGPNRMDRVMGSVAGGDGRRAAVLLADHDREDVAAVAATTNRPAMPDGWQAVQATALDGTVGVLAARFEGEDAATVELAGGPVLPDGVTIDGDVARWALSLDDVAARAAVAAATASSSAPVQASSPEPDVVWLENDGPEAADVEVTFAGGQSASGTVAAGASAVAVVDGGAALFGHPALLDLLDARDHDAAGGIQHHLRRAIDAVVGGNLDSALSQTLVALRRTSDGALQETLSRAAANLAGISLELPAATEVVRGDAPEDVEARLVYADEGWRAASDAELSVASDLAAAPVHAGGGRLQPGDTMTAAIPLTVSADQTGGSVTAEARVRMGPATIVLHAEGAVVAVDPFVIAADPGAVAVGGSIARPVDVRVTNRLRREVTLDVVIAGPDGLAMAQDSPNLTVPAQGEATMGLVLARDGVADGRHTVEVAVTADGGLTAGTTVPVHTSGDPALNPFGAGLPSATATSTQPGYPATNANDGDDGTFWVTAGTVAGEGPTPDRPAVLTVDLGAATTVGTVEVRPRVGYGPRDVVIEGRVDGEWTVLATVVQANATQRHAVPLTTVDAVRLVMTSGYDRVQPIRNVQLIGVSLDERVPATNQAAGAAVTASSSQGIYVPGRTVDGNPGTFWVSNVGAFPEAPQWLAVDLGREVDIEQLVVVPRLNGANDHGPRVMVWQVGDGQGGWTDVAAREKPRNASDVADVAVTARHVRLLVTSVWDSRNQNVQIAELEVRGR